MRSELGCGLNKVVDHLCKALRRGEVGVVTRPRDDRTLCRRSTCAYLLRDVPIGGVVLPVNKKDRRAKCRECIPEWGDTSRGAFFERAGELIGVVSFGASLDELGSFFRQLRDRPEERLLVPMVQECGEALLAE